jgi:hypothetical protein
MQHNYYCLNFTELYTDRFIGDTMTIVLVLIWLYNFFMLMIWLLVASSSGLFSITIIFLPLVLSIFGSLFIIRYNNVLTLSVLLFLVCVLTGGTIMYFQLFHYKSDYEILISVLLQLFGITLNSLVFPITANRHEFR